MGKTLFEQKRAIAAAKKLANVPACESCSKRPAVNEADCKDGFRAMCKPCLAELDADSVAAELNANTQ